MVSPSDSKLAELHQAVDLFLEETSTTPGDVDDLFRSLRFQPRTAPVSEILPADEVDQRLALAARVRGDNAMRRAIDVAILMTIPLDTLRGAASESHYQISFSDIQDFVRKMLQKRDKPLEGDHPPTSTLRKRKARSLDGGSDSGSGEDASYAPEREATAGKRSKGRDEKERTRCIARDGSACILLGTSSPEACHIIPFAINATERSLKGLGIGMFHYLWPADTHWTRHNLLTDHIACSDKAWNMVSMNRQMHKWWSECYFALKCLGIFPTQGQGSDVAVRLQFHWMSRRAMGQGDGAPGHWARRVGLHDGEAARMVHEWKGRARHGSHDAVPGGGLVSAADAASYRPLQTGRVVDIPMEMQEARDMKAMVDLQWAAIQIASMSGADGWVDFLEEDPVDKWLDGQSDESDDTGVTPGTPGGLSG